jgi:hypothetical protein
MYAKLTTVKEQRLFMFQGLDLDLNSFKKFETYIIVKDNFFHYYKETSIGMIIVQLNFNNIFIDVIK